MEGETASHGFDLLQVVALLAGAVIAVPLFKRLGLGSVLGYLAAGLVVGPYGLALFHDPQAIIHVAELGVVIFLFVIGLEMQPSRLWSMRGEIFGLGATQVGVCIALLTCVGLSLGYSLPESFVAGTGFVLTSTAIVMQMLEERRQLGLPSGRRIVAVLLLEDLAIVPLLAIIAFIAPGGGEEVTLAHRLTSVLTGLAAIGALVAAGLWLLDPLFGLLARSKAREVMTAAALLVVLGAALAMEWAGLSMAMGAFLAGVLLSESSFRHQLEADVEPFRRMLLGLFFLGVGMALDLQVIAANIGLIAICVTGYMILKMAGIYAVARLFRASSREAFERAVLMAQGGEFAFVLYAAATSAGIFTGEENAILTAMIIVSMVLTPLLIVLHDRLIPPEKPSMEGVEAVNNQRASVLLIGFGRFGQIASQPLLGQLCSITIIDIDPDAIRSAAEYGFKVHYGDGSRLDILHAAGAGEAKLVLVAMDDKTAAVKAVELMKSEFPHVPVLARAWDREHVLELVHAGVDWQIRETMESALVMAEEALRRLDNDEDTIRDLVASIRQRDRERLELEISGGIFAGRDLLIGNMKQN